MYCGPCSSNLYLTSSDAPAGPAHTPARRYLTPSITSYLQSFRSGFDAGLSTTPITFMRSDGGLTSVDDFQGHQAILSGPAGGFVGYAKTSYRVPPGGPASLSSPPPCIGFDMGGTSTDVSRYAGSLPHVFETTTANITIATPQLDITTVAAGGGSRLMLQVSRRARRRARRCCCVRRPEFLPQRCWFRPNSAPPLLSLPRSPARSPAASWSAPSRQAPTPARYATGNPEACSQ